MGLPVFFTMLTHLKYDFLPCFCLKILNSYSLRRLAERLNFNFRSIWLERQPDFAAPLRRFEKPKQTGSVKGRNDAPD